MNTKVTIPAHMVRAAMQFQAKGDIRYYLCGVLLAKSGDIVATDGHTLFKTFSRELAEAQIDADLIVKIDGTVPKSTYVCRFSIDEKRGTVECILAKSTKILSVEVIDGRFPDYRRVIPTKLGDESNNDLPTAGQIGHFDARLLARASVFSDSGFGGITLHLPESVNNAAAITPAWTAKADSHWPTGTVMVIMPVRAKADPRPIDGGTPDYLTDQNATQTA